jgi:hypothetical protein
VEILDKLIKFIIDNKLGEISSVLGVIIVFFGFFITIKNVKRTKQIAQKVRDDISKFNIVEEFSAVLMVMNEIKTLNREQAWTILPDRCSSVRKSLIAIKNSELHLSTDFKMQLQKSIQFFRDMEMKIDRIIAREEIPKNIFKINQGISEHVDDLRELLDEIKNVIGR